MQTLIEALREVLGEPDFYKQLSGINNNYTWDYGAMMEYLVGAMILMICVSYVFKAIKWLFSR